MQTHAKLLKRVFHFLKNPPRPVEGVWNPLECDKTVFLGSDRGLRPLGAAAVPGDGLFQRLGLPAKRSCSPGGGVCRHRKLRCCPGFQRDQRASVPLNNRAPPLPSPQGQGVLPYYLVFKSR